MMCTFVFLHNVFIKLSFLNICTNPHSTKQGHDSPIGEFVCQYFTTANLSRAKNTIKIEKDNIPLRKEVQDKIYYIIRIIHLSSISDLHRQIELESNYSLT